jgi:hypothetical protein
MKALDQGDEQVTGYTWSIHGLYMVYTWFLHGLYIVYTWFLHGLYMVYTWFIHGLYHVLTNMTCPNDLKCRFLIPRLN